MREPVVGEFGTGPAFVSKSAEQKRNQTKNREHVVALRTDFVVKPGKEAHVRESIDSILTNSFCREREFLQALVMVSETESRLVTVITFWNSSGFAEARERRMNWLRQKLTQYLDQSLRAQTWCARVLGTRSSNTEDKESGVECTYPSVTASFAALAS